MKKHTLNISVVSILCVLGAVSFSDAFAAGSVRALGGSGTYDGTTAAATRSGTTTARVGSLRISPSTTRSISTATRTNTDGTTTPTERLSIGKYLGGATSVSTSGGGSSSGGGSGEGGASAAEINQINQNIQQLFNTTQVIEQDITNLENEKQDSLTAGDYIKIENDEVSLDLGALQDAWGINTRYDSASDEIQVTTDGGATWTKVFKVSDLAGDYVTPAELEEEINDLAKKSEVNGLAARVAALETAMENLDIPDQVQSDWLQSNASDPSFIKNKPTIPANIATTDDLAGYATTDALNAKQDKIDDLADIRSGAAAGATAVQPDDLSDYAKTSDVESALAGKQDTLTFDTTPTTGSTNPVTSEGIKAAIAAAQLDGEVDLTNYPTKTEMNTALDGKQNTIDDLADIRSGAAAGATAVQPDDLDDYAKIADIPEQQQANWAETDDTNPSFILNKPTNLVTSDVLGDGFDANNTVADALDTKQDAINDLAAIRDNAAAGAGAAAALGDDFDADNTVADALEDLAADIDAIPEQVNSDWNATGGVAEILNKPDLANYVAKPEVPSTPGDYLLKVNNEGDTPTYSWVDATDYDNASGGGGADPTGPDFDWDDSGW
ncbi:MAG: hypothetical protein J6W40_03710 [Alphaproteobacteria bacterium]|nr:hypothetical protein [Alphaproteobacteria bacterium]